ncbi:hypothetical protein FGG79_11745 [Bacillus sp. BHET2]|uniref:Cap15 family cyclic dinucleotide receptor domain-containing protein n=1 Tax=Bacillus sp. BHET2 TaxID=2583818 RepID=UPI00110EB969|nr:hypothetical protein [Bacillus sp. BHET2]TMU85863.1 hypothetical protein FGG79_11745 [Bacillus sp. BHET2]
MHEYTVVDHPRRQIYFFLAIFSSSISGVISTYIHKWEYISFPVSSITIFGLLYLLLNHVIWKLKTFRKIYNFPNIEGEWDLNGLSKNSAQGKEYNWEGTITIKQTWDRVLITLKTKNSSSKSLSITGGIKHFPGDGYRLSYHYQNNTNATADSDMRNHEGFCVLTFSEDQQTAEGYYFNNNKDRQSHGEMCLIRREKDGKAKLSETTRSA